MNYCRGIGRRWLCKTARLHNRGTNGVVRWTYLYRAVDRERQIVNFMLSERRNLAAARRFLKRAISKNCVPDRVVIDKSGANLAGRQAVNVSLKFTGSGRVAEVRQIKYLQ